MSQVAMEHYQNSAMILRSIIYLAIIVALFHLYWGIIDKFTILRGTVLFFAAAVYKVRVAQFPPRFNF